MTGRRAGQSGQSLIGVIGAGLLLLAAVAAVAAAAGAHVAAVRAQRVADLTAVSAARVLLRAGPEAARSPHRARAAVAARVGDLPVQAGGRLERLWLPGARGGATGTSVEVTVSLPAPMGLRATAVARAGVEVVPGAGDTRAGWARGGGYSGPLVRRDGRPTCPAVAAAYDLMDAAARADGVTLVVTSGFRSDAEQAVLFARHPDPRWVAPPGRSRHRDATELDLGTPAAYRWLAGNAGRFGFVQRYSWEPWHYGYVPGCGPPAAAPLIAARRTPATPGLWGERPAAAGQQAAPAQATVPAWVPAAYRAAVLQAATSNGLPPALLAALLQAESGYDPTAVSPAGARGIAQFMPGTAAAMGVRDPFDPAQAIPAAGRLLGEHLRDFGSVPLALAAYNAGPGAVRRYAGVPPYAETRAYVARILALAGGAAAAPVSGAWATGVVLLPTTAVTA